MLRRFAAGLLLPTLLVALSACTAPVAMEDAAPRMMDIAQTPGLPRHDALQPDAAPRPIVNYPGADAAREEARDAATAGMPPGRLAGGSREGLTLRPAEEVQGRTPLPPPPPAEEPAKPVLTSPALRDLK